MSYPNQDVTLHQIHLNENVINHNCEYCWEELVINYIELEPINN